MTTPRFPWWPYLVALAAHGWRDACRADPALAHGLTTHQGALLNEAVAAAHGSTWTRAQDVLL